MNDDEMRGYKLAVLEIAAGMCLVDHIGDAWEAVCAAANKASLRLPDNDDGTFDFATLAAMRDEHRKLMGTPGA